MVTAGCLAGSLAAGLVVTAGCLAGSLFLVGTRPTGRWCTLRAVWLAVLARWPVWLGGWFSLTG